MPDCRGSSSASLVCFYSAVVTVSIKARIVKKEVVIVRPGVTPVGETVFVDDYQLSVDVVKTLVCSGDLIRGVS